MARKISEGANHFQNKSENVLFCTHGARLVAFYFQHNIDRDMCYLALL